MSKIKKVVMEPNCASLKLLSNTIADDGGLEERDSNGNINLKPRSDIAKSKIAKTPALNQAPNILGRKVPVPLQLIAVTREADQISLHTIDNKVQCMNGPNFTEFADYGRDLDEIETKFKDKENVEVISFSDDDQGRNDMRLALNETRLEDPKIHETDNLLDKKTYRLKKVPYKSGHKKKVTSTCGHKNELGPNGPFNEIQIENKDDYLFTKPLEPKAKILKLNSPFSCVNVDEMSKSLKTVHETSKLKSGESFFIASQEAFKSEKPILALYEEIVSIKKNKRKKKRRTITQKKGKNIDADKSDWCIKTAKTNKKKKPNTISKPSTIFTEEDPELIIVNHSANENNEKYDNVEEINSKQNYQSLNQVNNTLNETNPVNESVVELDVASDPMFRCNDCDSLFLNEQVLMEHRKILHGSFDLDKYQKYEDKYKDLLARYVYGFCTKCYKLADCRIYENEFLCQKCCNPLSSDDKPKQKRTRTCQICAREIDCKRWTVHTTEMHGNEKYKCNICNYEFKCKRYLQKHSKRHEKDNKPEQLVVCKECPKIFKANDSLSRHVKACHTNTTTVHTCDVCNSKLKSARNLQIHMEAVHCNKDGMKKFQCTTCRKYYKSEKYRYIHIKNYHPDTLPKCVQCGLRTANKQRLDVHMMHCTRKIGRPMNKEAGPSKIEELEDEELTIE